MSDFNTCRINICTTDTFDCSFLTVESIGDKQIAKAIKKDPSIGKIIDGVVHEPPCRNKVVVQKFKIQNICDLQIKISKNKEAFLNLMAFTKQIPTFIATETSNQSKQSLEKFGYTFKENKVQSRW